MPSQQWHSCQGFELQPMDLPSPFLSVRFSPSLLHTKNSGWITIKKTNPELFAQKVAELITDYLKKQTPAGLFAQLQIGFLLDFPMILPTKNHFFPRFLLTAHLGRHHHRCLPLRPYGVPRSKGRRSGSVGVLDAYTVYMVNSRYHLLYFCF